MFRYFYWLIFTAFILSFYVWQQTQATRLGYRVDVLRRECEKLENENKNYRYKVNCLLSMDRLDRIAKDKKLITPDEKSIFYLEG